jgi:hypothetical protein
MLIWIPAVLLSLPCAVADPDRLFLRSKRILVQKYLDFFAEWGGGALRLEVSSWLCCNNFELFSDI